MNACSWARVQTAFADELDLPISSMAPAKAVLRTRVFRPLLDTINEASGWLQGAVANLAAAAITNDSGFRALLPTNGCHTAQNAGGRMRTRRVRPSGPVSTTV